MMKAKLQSTGTEKFTASLKARNIKGPANVVGKVVYDAPHAIYVHEDLEAFHSEGQAKYLEQPAREMQQEMAQTTRETFRTTRSMEKAVGESLNRLLEVSQELVPVDTGELRESGHVVIEGAK